MKHYFTVTCSRGFEPILCKELRRLNLNNVNEGVGSVRFQGTISDGMKAALWTRLGSRVLIEIARFPGMDPDDLYDGIRDMPWEDHMDKHDTLWINFTGYSKQIRHSQFAARKAKDALVDRFRDLTGSRPSVDKDADLRIHIHLSHGMFSVAIDLCGDPLHLRTPNRQISDAPLKENLAAALLHWSGWVSQAKKGVPFIDPLCGSGAIALEAMGIACNKAANIERRDWNFKRWKQYEPKLWKKLVAEAIEGELDEPMAPIYAQDIDATAIRYVRANAKAQGVPCPILKVSPVNRLKPPEGAENGYIVTNPPYGERIGSHAHVDEVYEDLGFALAEFEGWKVFLLCPPNDLYLAAGYNRTGDRLTLHNGPLKCRFLELNLENPFVIPIRADNWEKTPEKEEKQGEETSEQASSSEYVPVSEGESKSEESSSSEESSRSEGTST